MGVLVDGRRGAVYVGRTRYVVGDNKRDQPSSAGEHHDAAAHPRGPVHLRAVDRRLAGARPLRRRHPRADRPGRDRPPARRARRLRAHLPRRRPDPVRLATRSRASSTSPASRRRSTRPGSSCRWRPPTCSRTPCSRTARFTSNNRDVRRFALRKVMRNLDLAAELGASTYVFWGGREGAETDSAKDVRAALDRYREGLDTLAAYVVEQGLRPPLRPRAEAQRAPRRHPAADDRARARLHLHPRAPRDGRAQPRGRSRADGRAQLRARHRPGAVAGQALPHRPQRPARRRSTTRTSSSGTATCSARSSWSTCWRTAGRPAGRPTTGRGTSTTSRCAPRTSTACGPRRPRTCAPTCCSRSGPRRSAPTPRCRRPWPQPGRRAAAADAADGESYADLLADRTAFEDFDADTRGVAGYGFGVPRPARRRARARRPLTTGSAAARDPRRRRRLLDAVVKVVVRDADTGALVRTGRAAHPDGTEVDPDAWWAALTDADRRGRRARRRRGARRRAASSTAWSASTSTARSCGPALLWNDTRSAGAAADLISDLGGGDDADGRRAWAEAVGSVPVAVVHRHQAALARRPRARVRRADGRGLPAARLADLEALRGDEPGLARSPTAATPAAPATGRRPRRRTASTCSPWPSATTS